MWDRGLVFHESLRGKTVGILGYGGIGRETARLAKALGMTVHVLARRPVGPRTDCFALGGTGDTDGTLPDRTFVKGSESDFYRSIDFLVLCVPLSAETEGLVGRGELGRMRRTACVLNPARGRLIDHEALVLALESRAIAGAALDVFAEEPLPPESPLWHIPNVIVTPHIAGAYKSLRSKELLCDLFHVNLRLLAERRQLLNRIDKQPLAETFGSVRP